eukprot:TRINITY_DN2716_c0_g1_i1.p1 TRINITY_DN2716_c0_g1~~TRINITY_DN2716_c0_g1_i1.p1  ORF type:complete len:411 (+),score=130.27 TRINITY_DN2716_c0_g1_i1:105-1235(+)
MADQTVTNKNNPIAVLETSMGTVKVELFLDTLPQTASNFIDLCRSGFYEGLHFHRVIPGFMCQFGCPHSKNPKGSSVVGTGNPPPGLYPNLASGRQEKRDQGGNIQDEFTKKISNAPGTLSMANTGQPNSGGSQFFLNVAHNKSLDWWEPPKSSQHPVFGKVVDNYELCVKISQQPTYNDNPVTPIRMHKITVENAPGEEALAPYYARQRGVSTGGTKTLSDMEKDRQREEDRQIREQKQSGEKNDGDRKSRSRSPRDRSRSRRKDDRGRSRSGGRRRDDSPKRDRRRPRSDSRDKKRRRSPSDRSRRRRDDSRDRKRRSRTPDKRRRRDSRSGDKGRRRRDSRSADKGRRRRDSRSEDRDRRRRDDSRDRRDRRR